MKRLHIFSFRPISALVLSCLLMVMSCTKDFEDINTNKNAVPVISSSELPFLFSKAQSAAPNSQYNYQVAQNLFADQYAQYFACVATYFPSDRLVIRMDWVGAAFNPMYVDVVPQLQNIFAQTDPNSAEYALANIWWVYTFHRVTDYWGPIPYFKAGVVASSVEYDPQDKIYDDFFKRLDAAVTALKTRTSEKPFEAFDLVYGGDVNKWIKLANSLRLRLAVRISNVDPARAKTEAEAAVAGGVFTTSPDDDAFVKRSLKGNDGNGLSIMSAWNEFRMSSAMESTLKGYEDPRLKEFFLPSLRTGDYEGLRNGLTSTQLTDESDVNTAAANSHVGLRYADSEVTTNPDYPAKSKNKLKLTGGNTAFSYLETPQNIMVTAEVYFLRAEGALLGWSMGATAKQLYESGIQNSLTQWGIKDAAVIQQYIDGTTLPVAPDDFLASPPMTDIPVKFDAGDVDIQREQIATQKWLALFPDGMEAWADYRRSHVLKLYPVVNSDNDDISNTSTQWIRRIPFLLSETQNNATAVKDAVKLLNGPDKVTTPLWWDKN